LPNPPPPVPRRLVTTAAHNPTASPHGWIDDGVNETRGNNVDAHTDTNADDAPDLPRPQGSPHRVFDYPLDLTQPPAAYRHAAVTQLFYWCNLLHDRLYELGFTESAGNFQVDNFGRGGRGGDPVQADAQDGEGFNNANFTVDADGIPGRMQMFVFDGPNPDRDGTLDTEIVIHEYAHGLSNRLVGGGAGISLLQSGGMGEGWSDFYALALLSEAGDDVNGAYAMGGYATRQLSGLAENYYFGIRRYPYSTDLAKNPLTFADIDPAQADSHPGVPLSPIAGDGGADEVHNMGEVWCVTLWEARARLVARHGFATGNELILQLVTDGMKLSPANPNFLQARDAILQADLVKTGGANLDQLWAAFARRGMGVSASSPPSRTTAGLRESFDVPDVLRILPANGLIARGPVGGPFEPDGQDFTFTNTSRAPLAWSAGGVPAWLHVSPSSGTLAPGGSATVRVALHPSAAGLPAGVLDGALSFTNTTSGRSHVRHFRLLIGQIDYFTELFDTTLNDTALQSYTFTPDGSASFYRVSREAATSFPTDPTGGVSLRLADDASVRVALANRKSVKLYGVGYTTFYVGSNGYVTLGRGDSVSEESFEAHFARPAIAAIFRDLDPSGGGSVSWRQLADRAAVTWRNVPDYLSSTSKSFQIEMFFDGRLRITILNIATQGGLIGLSRGRGVPAGAIESDFSSYGSGTPAPRSPAAPGALTIYMTSAGGVRVEWVDQSSDETGFEIERSTDGSGFGRIATAPANPDVAARIVDDAVTPGVSYSYRVRAVKGSLVSGYSPVGSITVPNPAPNAPGALTIYMTSAGGVRVEWVDQSSDETGFEIERSTDGSGFGRIATAPANPDVAARIVDDAVAPGVRYWYRVRAVKGSLASTYSPVGSIVTPVPPSPPAAPGALSISMTSAGNVRVEWVDRSNDETGFEIERSTNGSSFYRIATAPANPDGAARIVDSGVSRNTRYWYRVRALKDGLASGYSPTGSIVVSR
jgi:hypothetical protein